MTTPPPDARPSIAIIGAGRVGTALGVLARRSGYRVEAIAGRDPERLRTSARFIGGEVRICGPVEASATADFVFLTTPDDVLEEVAAELSAGGGLRAGGILAHCSGALTSEVLASARGAAGCGVASFHPLQTFPNLDAAIAALPGSHCFIEGDASAVDRLAAFGADLGLRCVSIEREAKVLYHAAAVLACNYLVTLMDAALSLDERAGIEREVAWEALETLVQATLRNVSELGTEAALTGPIARGDVETVRRHLAALEGGAREELTSLYRALGLWTVDLARRHGRAPEADLRSLRQLLASD